MKKLFLIGLYFLSFNAFSQYDVNINKEQKNIKREKKEEDIILREKLGGCDFIPLHDYKPGMKFYFPNDEYKIKSNYSYDNYYTISQIKKNRFEKKSIKYKDVAGKVFEIIKIEDRKESYFEDTYVILKQIDSSFVIEHKLSFKTQNSKEDWNSDTWRNRGLPDVVYAKEIDDFKTKYLNKELYAKFPVGDKKFKKVKVVEIGAGSEKKPIRAVVKDEEGNTKQIDFYTCGTNVSSIDFINSTYDYMEKYLSIENPKNNYKGIDDNWELICESNIKIGFTEEELLLSWGKPDRINESENINGERKQYVYSNQYVYLKDGIVTSFQNTK
ncbi:hypothetical protein K5I29_02220 [Flavobacterium agricola]|uniref:Uncharacterized protein n=1 Tax=Flavobacterium agricola TaxID=2870839 RepID=A0ABY6LZL7_9FLAO|nr:hypothetical protein [Flavobacterium agricola]UYW01760.1 hypothetical protein K5I29_02220 [Flavobacterium agricola]